MSTTFQNHVVKSNADSVKIIYMSVDLVKGVFGHSSTFYVQTSSTVTYDINCTPFNFHIFAICKDNLFKFSGNTQRNLVFHN